LKIAIIYNWIILAYLILVTFFSFNGNLAYGTGLGDLRFLILSALSAVSQFVIILIILSNQKGEFKAKPFYQCGIIYLFICLILTLSFTLGRGAEYKWNGNIFLHNPL
jgi:hypothetical protein